MTDGSEGGVGADGIEAVVLIDDEADEGTVSGLYDKDVGETAISC